MRDQRCETCKYAEYDETQGYVCDNMLSEYVSDFVEGDHGCEEYVFREDE